MVTSQQIHHCLVQLGELNDNIASIDESEDGNEWEIEMENGAIIEVEFDTERQRLILCTELADPPAEHRLHVLEMLMCYNLLWQEELPTRMALAGPGEAPIMTAEIAAEDFISEEYLSWAINEFSMQLDHWQDQATTGTLAAAPSIQSTIAHSERFA